MVKKSNLSLLKILTLLVIVSFTAHLFAQDSDSGDYGLPDSQDNAPIPWQPGAPADQPGTSAAQPSVPPQMPKQAPSDQQQMKIPPGIDLENGTTIAPNQFVFQGNSAVPTEQLQRLVYPYLNRSLAQSDINEIINRIQLLYKIKGYEGTKVIVSGSPRGTTLTVFIAEGKAPE